MGVGSLRGKSKERSSTRKVTPPSPSYMDSKQFASYLANLRDNRVSRPGGVRPLPSSASTITRRELERTDSTRPSVADSSIKCDQSVKPSHFRAHSDLARPPSIRPSLVGSVASRYTTMSGRDYYPDKASPVKPLKPDEIVPTATYMERGSRWMEKEEAVSLRTALEDMDLKDEQKKTSESEDNNDDETRIYNAALDEAAELVYQHQNGIKPPEPGTPYRYKPHMRENSYAHARTATIKGRSGDVVVSGLARDGTQSVSGGSSSGSERGASLESPRISLDEQPRTSSELNKVKPFGSIGERVSASGRRRSSMKRNISGEIEKPFSGDQIWEEPEGDAPNKESRNTKIIAKPAEGAAQPLRLKLRGPFNRVQFAPDPAAPAGDKPDPVSMPARPFHRVEIHKNEPTQSRNPAYTSNFSKPAGPRANDNIPKKNGVEIRGDDIRQATSFKLGDRSEKLPTPSAVSDNAGRPIVSFDNNWKPPEEAAADKNPEPVPEPIRLSIGVIPDTKEGANSKLQSLPNTQNPTHPPIPTISFTPVVQAPTPPASRPSSSAPPIPSISIASPSDNRPRPAIPTIAVTPDDAPSVPSIMVSGDDTPMIPTIVTPDDEDDKQDTSIPVIVTPGDNILAGNSNSTNPSARPLPTPARKNPFMRGSRGAPGHWSAAPGAVGSRATAICHECSFPIEGRVISLRGGPERFHPQCFTCYTCGTSLDRLEISPEPDSFRSARLERIARRAAGEVLPEEPGQTMAEDGDARLRFFCHLDWHELFAPRCKTCTTPILGDHIVALGNHYHYGHFFCAECGDPFEENMTHIEKDGYAWCVKCQTKRTERRAPKCKRCKLPVIGQYVQALGGEWHDECFRCGACGGGFDDGQIFPVTDGIRCTACRMKELKS